MFKGGVMYSSKKDLIEKIESEKERFQDKSQIADYENELYTRVENYLLTLIDLISKELDDEVLSNNVRKHVQLFWWQYLSV